MNPLCAVRRRALARYAALGRSLPAGSRLGRHLVRCEECRAAWHDLRHLTSELARTLTLPAAAETLTDAAWVRITGGGVRRHPNEAAREMQQGWPLKRGTPRARSASSESGCVHQGSAALERRASESLLDHLDRPGRAGFPRCGRRPIALATMGLAGLALFGVWLRGMAWRGLPSAPPTVTWAPLSRPGVVPRIAHPLPLGTGYPQRRQGPGAETRRREWVLVPLLPRFQPTARQALGDLVYLNEEPATALRRRGRPADEPIGYGVHLAPRPRGDDFVAVPLPRIAAAGPTGDRSAAEAADAYQRETAVVDARLARKVTLAVKATALSDLCERLRSDGGIQLGAGQSVADEKVTLFCREMPLRDVMRQLSRPFGYAWLRSGKPNEYRYELVQDLRSQLLEEELRNRDHNEALLALDREMQRYRKYLGLSPDEAQARAKTAPPEEKKLLEHMAVDGWGLVQIYFRLSPRDLATLRAGQSVRYSQEPGPDQQPLPPGLASGVLQSQRNRRIVPRGDGLGLGNAQNNPDGLLPAAVPEARAQLMLEMPQSEVGQFTFTGGPGVFIAAGSSRPGYFNVFGGAGALAVGMSPSVLNPKNAAVNAKLARDPALRSRVTVQLNSSCRLAPSPVRWPAWAAVAPVGAVPEPRVTTADVLEALHQTTGLPIVADYYTRLYPPTAVSVRNTSLFDALNQLADTMRLRWQKAGSWLQFRSTGFFNDRLKEVPNRLLARWATSRRQHGELTLDDLIEIAGLSDAQLDASSMAEGARACFGLTEWDLPRLSHVRPHLRFLAEFTPAQRQQAQTLEGLPFPQMTLAQQQGYLARAFLRDGEARLDDLARATLYVDYSMPGGFRWSPSGREDRPWPVRERTREAALQAAHRIDAQAAEERVVPTPLDMTILYMPHPGAGPVHLVNSQNDGFL